MTLVTEKARPVSKTIPDTSPARSCSFVGAIPFGRVARARSNGSPCARARPGKRNVKNRGRFARARLESGTTIFVPVRCAIPMHPRNPPDKPAKFTASGPHRTPGSPSLSLSAMLSRGGFTCRRRSDKRVDERIE